MRARPLTRRHQADLDILAAIDHYLSEGAAAPAFVAALEKAFRHIASHPRSGSSRFAHELSLPGLRSWPLATFPYLVFYAEREEAIEVWRVLDTHRDIAPWLMSPDTL